MPIYPILIPIRRNGVVHRTGTLELEPAEAAPLITLGALGPALPEATQEQEDQLPDAPPAAPVEEAAQPEEQAAPAPAPEAQAAGAKRNRKGS